MRRSDLISDSKIVYLIIKPKIIYHAKYSVCIFIVYPEQIGFVSDTFRKAESSAVSLRNILPPPPAPTPLRKLSSLHSFFYKTVRS